MKKERSKLKDEDKDLYKTIEVWIDPSDKGSDSETIEKRVKQFDNGSAEEWIQWRIEFAEVESGYPLTKASSKTSMALTQKVEQGSCSKQQMPIARAKMQASRNQPKKILNRSLNWYLTM